MLNLNLIFSNIGEMCKYRITAILQNMISTIPPSSKNYLHQHGKLYVCSGICIWNGHMLQGDINTHWKVPIIDPPNFKEMTMVALSHQLRSLMKTTRRQLRRAACFTCIVRLSNNWNNHSRNIHLQSAPLYNVHNIQIFRYLPVSDTGQPGQ